MIDEPTLPSDTKQGNVEAPQVLATWGTFSLRARVGQGGFGEVYRAWDPHLEREVALKLLLPSAVGGESQYAAMLREARALASVRHQNIVSVYGIDRHEGRVGFWTDFVRGRTLSVLLDSQGAFGHREAALIGLDVTKALCAVHRAGLLHRDVKAENVMREEGGRILLMDFGLSTLPQLQTGLAGTPRYMAPELFGGGPATVSTDIYAMGVLLYYLVAGEHPVKLNGLTPGDVAEAMACRRPLMDLRPDLPESFLRTVSLAMEIDPAKRFGSAGQLAAALAESLGVPVPEQSIGLFAVPPVPGAKTSNRATLLTSLAVAVLAAVALSLPGVRSWLKLTKLPESKSERNGAIAAGVSTSTYDQFQKAQDLLLHSYKNANTAAAVTGFQEVLKADPSFALAEAGLGSAYFIQYRNIHDAKLLDMAKVATARAISLDPKLAPAYVTLARMAAMEGQTSLAMQQAEKARSLDPRSADAYGALADVYDAQGRTSDAIAAVQKAIDLAPEDWRWPVNLGIDQFSSGNAREAVVQLQKGVDLAPDNAIAYYDLGIANMQLDKMADARNDFEKSLKIEPDADTYSALGGLLMVDGEYADAAAMDLKATQLNPSDYAAWGNLGAAYLWSTKGRDKAASAFHHAIELAEAARAKDGKNPSLLALLANYYASAGNTQQSLTLIRQALALAPDNPSIAYKCGDAYEALGQRGKAIELIAGALAQGYNTNEFQHNPELAALRNDPAFTAALNKAKSEITLDAARKNN